MEERADAMMILVSFYYRANIIAGMRATYRRKCNIENKSVTGFMNLSTIMLQIIRCKQRNGLAMLHIINKIITVSIFVLILFSVQVTDATVTTVSSDEIEETADMILDGDNIITGNMNEYSSKRIVVDGLGYNLCDGILIFSTRNRMIKLVDIGAAKEVKMFVTRNCVRKITVLRFGE
jgi:hypothetical protein